MKALEKEELMFIVERAFADVQYPGSENLVSAYNSNDQERLDTYSFFYQKHWKELAYGGQKLQIGWGGLPFLSPQAWQFYLPAYMLAALTETSIFHEIKDTTFFNVTPPVSAGLQIYFEKRVSGLSPAQMQAIYDFVVYICQELPIEYAEDCQSVKSYWGSKLEMVAKVK